METGRCAAHEWLYKEYTRELLMLPTNTVWFARKQSIDSWVALLNIDSSYYCIYHCALAWVIRCEWKFRSTVTFNATRASFMLQDFFQGRFALVEVAIEERDSQRPLVAVSIKALSQVKGCASSSWRAELPRLLPVVAGKYWGGSGNLSVCHKITLANTTRLIKGSLVQKLLSYRDLKSGQLQVKVAARKSHRTRESPRRKLWWKCSVWCGWSVAFPGSASFGEIGRVTICGRGTAFELSHFRFEAISHKDRIWKPAGARDALFLFQNASPKLASSTNERVRDDSYHARIIIRSAADQRGRLVRFLSWIAVVFLWFASQGFLRPLYWTFDALFTPEHRVLDLLCTLSPSLRHHNIVGLLM